MSLTFPPMNNQATISTTTANSNILVTLTFLSTITTTVISSASGTVSISPAPAISVAATGQDVNFETKMNAMENTIFKLGSTLEKFISTNNPPGRSRGESDRGYLTDFSANASKSEIDQFSGEESNCGPPPQKKPSRNAVNVDICSRASKDVFDKDINLLVPDVKKQNQSDKVSSAANDFAIFEEINKEKMREEELGPAISSQLAEVAMKYWSEESKNPVAVNKILDGLKIPAICSGVCVPILNEAAPKNRKIISFHKRADKRLSDIQKGLIFATSAVLEIADELILAQNEIRPPNLKKVMGHTVDSITLLGRAHKQISAERKERLKPVLNEDIRTLCDKETSDSKYLFGENLLESMKEAKESFRISNSLVNNYTPKLQKVSYQSGSKRSFGYTNGGAGARFSASHSLNFQGRKRNHQHRGQSSSSTKYINSKRSHKY